MITRFASSVPWRSNTPNCPIQLLEPRHDCRGFHEKATLCQAESFGFFRRVHFPILSRPTGGQGSPLGFPQAPFPLSEVIFITVYGCQGRALLARRRDIFVLFKNVSSRTLDCRGPLWKLAEKGKGALFGFVTCSPVVPSGFLLRRLANRDVPCRRSFLSPSDFPICAIFFAKLPYALVEALRPPCRLRSFILGADNLGSEISPLLSASAVICRALAVTRTRRWVSSSVRLRLASVRPFFTSCRDRRC